MTLIGPNLRKIVTALRLSKINPTPNVTIRRTFYLLIDHGWTDVFSTSGAHFVLSKRTNENPAITVT
jgi:hypothetical protein